MLWQQDVLEEIILFSRHVINLTIKFNGYLSDFSYMKKYFNRQYAASDTRVLYMKTEDGEDK